MPYYLGLDGGGTKTAASLLDEAGMERGRGEGGPCNIATCDDSTLRDSVRRAAAGALAAAGLPPDAALAGVCAGVAGYTAKGRRAEFARLLAEAVRAERCRVEPDFVIAYWGATEGEPGVIVSAGTGAVVYGRNTAGETCRIDGRGFLLGDEGSGYSIGQLALQKTLARFQNGWPLDDFDRRLLAAIGAEDADDLIEWVYRDLQPAKIAALASLVGSLAAEGDIFAIERIRSAGFHLATSANVVQERLGMTIDTAPVYLIGGLWNISERLRRVFEGVLKDFWCTGEDENLRVDIRAPKHDPAYGAAYLAMNPDA